MTHYLFAKNYFVRAQHMLLAGLLTVAAVAHADTQVLPTSNAELAPLATFEMPAFKGESKHLEDYRGDIVLVDFWASWCSPCRSSFPWMNNMANKYRDDGFKIVAINLDQDRANALDFLQSLPPEFDVLFNPDGQMPEAFEVIGMPTSFLLDRQGRVRATHIGFHSDQTAAYEQQIQQLIHEDL